MKTNHFDKGLNEKELGMLVSFFPDVKDLTIKEIRKRVSFSSYERVNHYLGLLAQRGILKEKKVGKTLVYALNTDDWYARLAHYHYASLEFIRFSKKHRTIYHALRNLSQNDVEIVIVFGSYARGKERRESDIDVLVVSSNKKETETSLKQVKAIYPLNLQAVILPRTEFVKMKAENQELWNDLVCNGIIFKGYDDFYSYAYQNKL